jgi:transcriptional regulator
MTSSLELLRGTLDVLILKAVAWEPIHGYGISRWIRTVTGGALQVEEGALYPALRRLEKRGLLESDWRPTETGREARFYTLTDEGRRELSAGMDHWKRYSAAMEQVLRAPGPA